MIRRPLDARFSVAVLRDQKCTTIRDKPWPVRVPIMLYNWSGAPYRSKQVDVAPVKVSGFWPIVITHKADGTMCYQTGRRDNPPLHHVEGFGSREEMDAWFRPLVPRGQSVTKALMRFFRQRR